MTTSHPFWCAFFGNDAPVEIEVGAATGSFLIPAARQRPATNFLGIEHAGSRARRLIDRVKALDSPRVRALHGDATCVIAHLVPPSSVAAYHIYFPDPWPKQRHARRRLFTAHFVDDLVRTLTPTGRLLLATDIFGWARVIRGRLLADGGLEEIDVGADHPGLETAFARKYRAAGRPTYPLAFGRPVSPGPLVTPSAGAAAIASKIRSR